MKYKKYIGHSSQISGVEEYRLVGGKGDGMRLMEVKNGLGLQFTVSQDRTADITRLSFKGDNYSYFSPCGYVAPVYYDDKGSGFLKSFTAGFLTTCGLTAVGTPCMDEGKELPLHGTINNTPSEHCYYTENDEEINIYATMNQMGIFADKLMMYRKIICSKTRNQIVIEDTIENMGDEKTPLMILYHMNIGYPLLSENALLNIPSSDVIARNEHARKDIKTWDRMQEPQSGFEEQCYYHKFDSQLGMARIFNPDIDKGLMITFDTRVLDYFVQWKMLGVKDYVLGLEPGNCLPDGRDKMRQENTLKFLDSEEKITYRVQIDMIQGIDDWKRIINQ
nr:aldose 1-epimerase family protein [uncultured Clostridium sp.]